MKKILIVLLVVVFSTIGLSSLSFAQTYEDVYNYQDVIEEGLALMEENLAFLGAYGAYALQSGQFAPTDVLFINVGLTANFAFIDFPDFIVDNFDIVGSEETQYLKDYSMLPMGFLYVGLKVPILPIKLYARVFYLPANTINGFNEDLLILGLGAAYTLGLPLIEITATGNYHFMNGIEMIDIHSYGLQGIVAFDIPVINWLLKPYVAVGWSMTSVSVHFDLLDIYDVSDVISLPPEVPGEVVDVLDGAGVFNQTYTYALNFPISLGVRVNILLLKLVVEYTSTIEKLFTWPMKGAISLSLGFGF